MDIIINKKLVKNLITIAGNKTNKIESDIAFNTLDNLLQDY